MLVNTRTSIFELKHYRRGRNKRGEFSRVQKKKIIIFISHTFIDAKCNTMSVYQCSAAFKLVHVECSTTKCTKDTKYCIDIYTT